jgi:hypothetical protein
MNLEDASIEELYNELRRRGEPDFKEAFSKIQGYLEDKDYNHTFKILFIERDIVISRNNRETEFSTGIFGLNEEKTQTIPVNINNLPEALLNLLREVLIIKK